MIKLVNRYALLMAIALTLVSGCAYKLVRHGELNEPYYETIRERVSAERGLPWKRDVPVRIIDRKQVRTLLEEEMNKEFPPERVKELERAYVLMGLIPPGTDLRETLLGFLTGAGAGFYDPEDNILYLVKGAVGGGSFVGIITRRDMTAELVVAHELCHALDDQYYDLDTLGNEYEDNDDAILAITALEEGSATVVGFAVIYRPRMSMEEVFAAVKRFNRLNKTLLGLFSPSTPSVIRDMLLFSYVSGSEFIAALYMAGGGWERVNGAFENPPDSSESILRPEKFIKGNDHPRIPELEISAQYLGDGWAELDRNTMGEYGIQALLGRFLGKEEAVNAAAGWGGDRYVVAESPDAETRVWIWVTVWDTGEDALQFQQAYRDLLAKKYEQLKPVETNAYGGMWTIDNGRTVKMLRKADELIIIEGADPATTLQILRGMGRDSN